MKPIDFRLSGEGDSDNPYKYTPKSPVEKLAYELSTEINKAKERILLEVVEILLGRVPADDEVKRRLRRMIYRGMKDDEEIIEMDGIPIIWFRTVFKDGKWLLEYRRSVRDEQT